MKENTSPRLVLGPLLRYAGETDATVWVETDSPCEVTVRAGETEQSSLTFTVEGHYYALVVLTKLKPGRVYGYEVLLGGTRVWPEAGSEYPASVIRTHSGGESFTLAYGSCRVAVPHEAPHTYRRGYSMKMGGEHFERDALYGMAHRMSREGHRQANEDWPDALLLLGDQIYADEVSEEILDYIKSRREPGEEPGDQIADFEEYTRLYREAWLAPHMRWLLSTVPSAMIFDDHDVHDDWNTSEAWVEKMRKTDWWEERITGAFMSYWVYQHLGNLSPKELAEDPIFREIDSHPDRDISAALRDFARRADRDPEAARWSYHRDFGRTRLIVIDSRAGRVVKEDERDMLDEAEWRWVEEKAAGTFDHLILGTSLPYILAPALHDLEAANESICGGAWGERASKAGEFVRQYVDLEHWPAFDRSFQRLTALIHSVASGGSSGDNPPASVVVISGDVHHGYLTRLDLGSGLQSPVYQSVSSPVRNPLGKPERLIITVGWTRFAAHVAGFIARRAKAPKPGISWRRVEEKTWFDNHVSTLRLRGRDAVLKVEKTVPEGEGPPDLFEILDHRIS